MCFDKMPCEPVEREDTGSGGGTVGTPPPVTKPKTGGGAFNTLVPRALGLGQKDFSDTYSSHRYRRLGWRG